MFGIPAEKRVNDITEEWLYKFDGRKPADEVRNTTTTNLAEFTLPKKYLIFGFNKQGNVTGWNCQGVQFAEKKNNVPGTILLALAGAIVIASIFIKIQVPEGL